jgi:hypothetical protein
MFMHMRMLSAMVLCARMCAADAANWQIAGANLTGLMFRAFT